MITLEQAQAALEAGEPCAVIYRRRGVPAEHGVITGANDSFVFVRYGSHPTPAATYPADLEFAPCYLVGVQDGWHAIDPADVLPGCVNHRWSVCGALVRQAVDDGGDPRPYDWRSLPVSYDPCPACMWTVAARTGTLDAVLDVLVADVAHDAAADILNIAGREEREPDDDETLHLLTAVSRHAPVLLLREECAEEECPGGDCTHDGRLACRACSLQAGGWAGEREGTYLYECTIPAPCAVLLELARTAKASVAEHAIGTLPVGEVPS